MVKTETEVQELALSLMSDLLAGIETRMGEWAGLWESTMNAGFQDVAANSYAALEREANEMKAAIKKLNDIALSKPPSGGLAGFATCN